MDQFPLEIVLTMAGGTVAAGLIASVVQILKRVPAFGAWLDAGREPLFVLLLAAALVVYAALATITVWLPATPFAVFLAWVGIAALATKAYDVSPDSLKTILGGAS
jgi:hypothetical protein